jgi:hypothetical protein
MCYYSYDTASNSLQIGIGIHYTHYNSNSFLINVTAYELALHD